ncbi:helix-turn-helix transcriptional regulator [uncultured Desulfobacter sp.]|uniref:helix-turn-helix domain-containing protein n=1 Tax=uncultured Desulfobacter sp. TaxID=240139 RepID=UPI002AA8A86B|nr:helix-turn-helix transcriptional regulator [uncultured Desulfobacter sp.]
MTERFRFIMVTDQLRKSFGVRIKELRKSKKWTQKELANKLDVRFPQLNKYECGLHTPPMDKLIKMSEVFDTTIDYLLTGNRMEDSPLHNLRLLERFQALEDFSNEDQETVIKLIDAMIVKNKVEGAIKPFGQRAG